MDIRLGHSNTSRQTVFANLRSTDGQSECLRLSLKVLRSKSGDELFFCVEIISHARLKWCGGDILERSHMKEDQCYCMEMAKKHKHCMFAMLVQTRVQFLVANSI